MAEILRNIVAAIDPEYASLLIDSLVFPTKDTQLRRTLEDILMMVTLNVLERTSRQYEELLCAAGQKVVKLFVLGGEEEMSMGVDVARSGWLDLRVCAEI